MFQKSIQSVKRIKNFQIKANFLLDSKKFHTYSQIWRSFEDSNLEL